MSAVDEQPAAADGERSDDLPIARYTELTVARVLPELEDLSPVQLRQVRDFERRHANRVAVLEAIERALA